MIAHLNGTRNASDLNIGAWAPATDVIGLTALHANQVVERLKWHQRQTSGRMDEAVLTQVRKQLQEGGSSETQSIH
ncbi:MAG: hypothetical protein K8T91_13505 [Planctomycetes bacterium]|nr:hypothetical protein [Planctomycetota bacterium]